MAALAPKIVMGIPTWGRVSVEWSLAMAALQWPLGSSMGRTFIKGEEIAAARNQIVQHALEGKAEYLFFLGDDVIAPSNAVLQLLSRKREIVTGVYWTKTFPPEPYLWRGLLKGSYQDWKAGEFFEVDLAGCDCLLVHSDVFRALDSPWFSRDWVWTGEDGERPSVLATEDFYFFTKARKAGFRLWCDSQVQCLHEDRETGAQFGLTVEMPQARKEGEEIGVFAGKRIADLGCGMDTPCWPGAKVVRFDLRESVKPDVRCDLRQIPEPEETYDIVHARHVLEHFRREEAVPVVREWARLLKVGGELQLNVPDLESAMEHLLAAERGERDPDLYPWWQLYGAQANPYDCHFNGFTRRSLAKLLEVCGLSEVQVERDGTNLSAKAIKAHPQRPPALKTWWDEIHRAESRGGGGSIPPLNPEDEPMSLSEVFPEVPHAEEIPSEAPAAV